MKVAIFVLSDPKSGTEEALGRVFNALGAALDFKKRGDDVQIIFQGTGARWIAELTKEDHPAHGFYTEVKDKVTGVSRGCAEAFGAADDVQKCGLNLLTDNAAPGTPGLASFAQLAADGYTILTF